MDNQTLRYVLFGLAIAVPVAVSAVFGRLAQKIAERKGYPDSFGFLLGFYFGPFGILMARRMSPLMHKIGSGFDELLDATENRKKALNWPVVRTADRGTQVLYQRRRPSAVAILTLLSVAFASTSYLRYFRPDVEVASADVRDVPYEKGDWRCVQEDTSDSSLQEQIQADSYVLRNYINQRTGDSVQLYLIYRRYGRREFNHNPDQCFPAGGYVLMNRRSDTVPYAGGEHEMVRMDFNGKRVEIPGGKGEGVPDATVSYFFASGNRTESVFLRQQLWMATEKLVPNKNGWTLVRLNTPWQQMELARRDNKLEVTGIHPIDAEKAWKAQRDFMTTFGPEIERVITTDTSAPGEHPLVADGK